MNNWLNKKTIRWLLFSVSFSFCPILMKALFVKLQTGDLFDLKSVLLDGELLLMGCLICGSGLGEIFGENTKDISFRIMLVGFISLVIILFSAGIYGFIGTLDNPKEEMLSVVYKISWMLYETSIFLGLICVYLANTIEKQGGK